MSDMDRTSMLRWIGVVAALACAVIYGLIGLGVVSIGESTTEATTDPRSATVTTVGVAGATGLGASVARIVGETRAGTATKGRGAARNADAASAPRGRTAAACARSGACARSRSGRRS